MIYIGLTGAEMDHWHHLYGPSLWSDFSKCFLPFRYELTPFCKGSLAYLICYSFDVFVEGVIDSQLQLIDTSFVVDSLCHYGSRIFH